MNDRINNNQGVVSHGKKTKLEGQIALLKEQAQEIIKQLKIWESKLKKANNFLY